MRRVPTGGPAPTQHPAPARASVHLRPKAGSLLLAVLAAAASVTLLAFAYARARGIPAEELTRDPVQVLDGRLHVGVISRLGVLVAWGCALASATGGWVLRRLGERRAGLALLAAAALTGLLAVSDLLLVHEGVAPALGVPEAAALGLYALLGAGWALRFREFLRTADLGTTVLAGVLAVGSVAVDHVGEHRGTEYAFVEDSLKLLAIVAWSLFLGRETVVRLRRATTSSIERRA